jgi:S-DNA-T family DNA segregation ATPase FtsK/SpoIIIE
VRTTTVRHKAAEPTASLQATLSPRRRELGLVALLLFASFATVSVAGHVPADPTWLHPAPGRVANPCGPLGAEISRLLVDAFGQGAWLVVGVVVACVAGLAGRPMADRVRTPIGVAMAVCLLVLGDLAFGRAAGGAVGAALSETLRAGLGALGAWLAVASILLLGATVLFDIRWSALSRRLLAWLEGRVPVWTEQSAVAAGWGRDHAAHAARVGASASAHALRGAWGMSTRAGGRAWSALRRVERGDDGSTAEDRADEGALGGPSEGFGERFAGGFEPLSEADGAAPVAEGDTLGGMPDGVAEVRWEPTATATAAGAAVLGLFPEMQKRTRGAVVERDEPTATAADLAERTEVPAAEAGVKDEPVAEPSVQTPARRDAVVRKSAHLEGKVRDDGGAVQRAASFELPRLANLDLVPTQRASFDPEELRAMARLVEETLLSFKVSGAVTDVRVGPVVTTLEYLPDRGISVRRVAALADDLAMSLRALSVRIVAPIPGKGVVGIEIPSSQRLTIYLRELLASDSFRNAKGALPVVLGKDVEGAPIVADLASMPHLLVGGSTGSGKSVGVNGMLLSLLFTRSPDELRLLLVDPKKLEFKPYEDIPHLLHPVVTEPKQAAAALAWACREMDERYALLARWDTRNIASYNKRVETELKDWSAEKARRFAPAAWPDDEPPPRPEKLPYIVIVIDELADLMLVARKEVESSVARLTQMARACGIHLIVATQRPSVDVVTGLIKSNLPTRIAFKLRTVIDSRTVLDAGGAEALLGRGDLLYLPNAGDLVRLHGPFVSDEEVVRVADFLRTQGRPRYVHHITEDPDAPPEIDEAERDDLYDEAVAIVRQKGMASTSMVQRHLKIGYNRAARIIELMEIAGVVGPADGARPREVIERGRAG